MSEQDRGQRQARAAASGTAGERCPTCGQRVDASIPATSADPAPPTRWRVQYWRNPVPGRDAVMELGVFTPEGDLLYAAPLTERNDQLAQAIVAAMNEPRHPDEAGRLGP
jgi:hypothetical protein